MSMALCLGTTGAFAAAPGNDDCGINPIALTAGAPCTIGTNVDATIENTATDSTTCWDSDPDATVWYTFTPTASNSFTISTDLGDGSSPDTQIQIMEGTCGAWTNIICDEDGGTCSGLASSVTANLTNGTTYYVMVDIFGATEGEFCISVTDNNAETANDCIANAIPISTLINTIDASTPFSGASYDYINITKDEISAVDGSGGTTSYQGCFNPLANGTEEVYFGTWFKFNYDSTKKTWLSVYPENTDACDDSEDIFYTMHLFSVDSTNGCIAYIPQPPSGVLGLGCSAGDGINANGGSEDKACGSFFDHPRLDINTGLNHGDEYYVMVAQMTRVTTVVGTCPVITFDPNTGEADTTYVPCNTEVIAEPSNGKFKLLAEAAPLATTSIDTKSGDNCDNAFPLVDEVTYPNLTNAGLIGNLFAANSGTCNAGPAANEPLQYDYVASGRGYNNEHCDSTGLTLPVGAVGFYNNNSAVYSFVVEESVVDGEVICFNKDSLKADILSDFDLLCDSAVVIYTSNFPAIYSPVDGSLIIDLGAELTIVLGDSVIVIPEDATCTEIRTILETALCLAFDLLLNDEVCIPLNCSPAVNISLCNLTMCGNENDGAAVWVTEGDCVNGAEVMFAPIDNGTTALTLNSALQPLAPGTYYIVVDGHGAVLGYDLTVDVSYRLGLGGVPCGPDAAPEARMALANQPQTLFEDMSLMPNPANNELTINFKLENDLNSVNVSVIDMTGKEVIPTYEVSTTAGMNAHTIDVSDLSSGLYMISVEKDGQTSVSRFSKN